MVPELFHIISKIISQNNVTYLLCFASDNFKNQRDFRDEPQEFHLLNQERETKGLSALPTTELKLEPKVESLESAALRDFFCLFLFVLFLFLAVLGLCCCVWAFSSCGKRGLLFAVHGLLIVVASLVVEHGLQAQGFQQLWHTGSVAPRHVGSSQARDQTRVPPALAGRFLSTAPPGKP